MAKFTLLFFKKLPPHEKKITLSTCFTLLRIALVPFIIGSMLASYWGVACTLFVIAAVTDILDGNIARWRNERTFLGACLDPIADKVLILSVFFTLAFIQSPLFSIPHWFVVLVLVKEMILVFGALAVFGIKGHVEIQPTWLGKITTVVQMGFITWLFACYFFAWLPIKTYYTMLGMVLILVFITLVQYGRIGFYQLRL